MIIRNETQQDIAAIERITADAFRAMPFSNQNENEIMSGLRAANVVTLSLVAERDGAIVGHAAFSPVTIDGKACGWYGLGPVAVDPAHQKAGIGSALIRDGLERLKVEGAKGCVVLGDPDYYGRFGFNANPELFYPGPPPEDFQALSFGNSHPTGQVRYHAAFDI